MPANGFEGKSIKISWRLNWGRVNSKGYMCLKLEWENTRVTGITTL